MTPWRNHELSMVSPEFLVNAEIPRNPVTVAMKRKTSFKNPIKRLIKIGAKVVSHGRRWQVYVASAFPLAPHYRAVFE